MVGSMDATLFVVGHRLSSILQMQRVIIEFGSPQALAPKPNPVFAGILRQAALLPAAVGIER